MRRRPRRPFRRGTGGWSETGSERVRPAAVVGATGPRARSARGRRGGLPAGRRGWDERCRLDDRPWGSDPVLGGSDVSRLPISASNAGEDHAVHLSDQAGAEGQRLKALETRLHGTDVVHDLLDIGGERLPAGLGVEHLEQRRLRALDSGRGHGLPTEVRPDQQVRVGQEAAGASEAAERRLGVCQPQEVRRGDLDRAGDGSWEVGDVPVGARRPTGAAERCVCVAGGVDTTHATPHPKECSGLL